MFASCSARKMLLGRGAISGDKKCAAFGQAFSDQAKIAKALAPGGKGKVFCPDYGKPILLRDVIEEKSGVNLRPPPCGPSGALRGRSGGWRGVRRRWGG